MIKIDTFILNQIINLNYKLAKYTQPKKDISYGKEKGLFGRKYKATNNYDKSK